MNFAPLIIDTGGTFNKRYQPIDGSLQVNPATDALDVILASTAENLRPEIRSPMRVDSLEMTAEHRNLICQQIHDHPQTHVLVIHGTDTMDQTAQAIDQYLTEHTLTRCVVLTGAMVPFSIDPTESALNTGLALGFLQAAPEPGVYIAMSGRVARYTQLRKDRAAGVFQVKDNG